MRFITQGEYEKIIANDRSWTPSVSTQSRDDYSEVFWKMSASIKKGLSAIGTSHEGSGGGDFWMNHGFDDSRRLSIEVSEEKILSPKMISIIQDALQASEERWRVDITHDILRIPDFFLLVYRDDWCALGDHDFVIDTFLNSKK